MKAASISYRVADFLRRHPPFEWMEEAELVDLAMVGRVRFHEALEVLHDAGEERQSRFMVIQQGTVEIVDPDGELRDLLGPGDIVGIGSSERHRYCARTASDVLVYVFPTAALQALLGRHPRARRYLEAVFSLAAEDRAGGLASLGPSGLWLDGLLPADAAECEASSCGPGESIREVASRLTREGLSAVAVVGEDGRVLGIVRDADFRARVATGEVSAAEPMRALLPFVPMRPPPVDPGRPVGDYWRTMLRAEASALPVVVGGVVRGVVTENDLMVRTEHDPLVPILRIGRARDLDQVRSFRDAADTAVERLLADRNSARWAMEAVGALDSATCRRVISRAEVDLEIDDGAARRCWVFLGAAGRRERFGAMPLGLGLLWDGDASHRERMRRLADRVGADLRELGVGLADHALPSVGGAPTRGSLEDWSKAYDGWVHEPIGSGMYEALAFFDCLPISGDFAMIADLSRHVLAEISGDEAFLPLLANDSLAHLPPLTFFRGRVVDKTGERTELLHLENCAVRPLTDVARVFALQAGDDGDADTAGRLRRAAAALPAHELLFRRAAEAFELALLLRARVAYAGPDDRPEVRAESLPKVERELLKSCFRTILELLEMTAEHFGFPAPR